MKNLKPDTCIYFFFEKAISDEETLKNNALFEKELLRTKLYLMINFKNKAISNEEALKNKATCISDEETFKYKAITNEETFKYKAISDKASF